MLESKFQAKLIKKIKNYFDGCIVVKNDPLYIQGMPDLLILFKNKWAALEVKRSNNASHQPNQDFYISKMSGMSYANFISPDNEEEVMEELKRFFS